jgi:predicted Fe-Mo cluster-binding NifX family protein
MKIGITATAPGLDAHVDPRLEGAAFFTIVDTDNNTIESVPNDLRNLPTGAEEETAKMVAKLGAKALISEHVSPRAQEILSTSGVKVYPYSGGVVEDAIEQFRNGELRTQEELAGMRDVPSGIGSEHGRGTGPEAEGQGFKAKR